MTDDAGGVSMLPPAFEPLRLECKACGHEWRDWQPSMVPFRTAIAHFRALRCPECGAGSGSLLLGGDTPSDDHEASTGGTP